MIRFGIVLSVVLIAIGLLVTGVVAGSLLLVVTSIGVALLAFLVLIGVVISFRHEIFGRAPRDVAAAKPSMTAQAGLGAIARGASPAEPAMAGSRPNREAVSRPGAKQAARPGAKQAARPGAEQAVRPGAEQAVRPGAKQAARPGAEQAVRPGAKEAARSGAEQAARPHRVSPADRRDQDRSGRDQDDSRDHSRGKRPPAQPVPESASAEAADRSQQAAAARTKQHPASLSKAQPKADQTAERERSAPSAPRTRQDESAERDRVTQERARPEPAATGPAGGGRTTGDFEGSNRNRLAAQHGAGRLDRPSSEQVAERDHGEPRRPSRLERESARAAGSRPSAPDPSLRGRPADAPDKPELFTPSAAGAAVTGAAVPRDTPQPADAEAPATSETAAKPVRAQAGPVVSAPADSNESGPEQDSTEQAGTRSADSGQAGTGPADAGLRDRAGEPDDQGPDAPADRQADNGKQAGSPAAAASQPAAGGEDGAGHEPQADDDVQVSVVPGITRYHKSDCQLIRFLSADDLEVMTRKAATEGGCVPCKACKPDQVAAGATSG